MKKIVVYSYNEISHGTSTPISVAQLQGTQIARVGNSVPEAIGNLVHDCPDQFGIVIEDEGHKGER